jgi:hypothetical protein
LPPPRSASASSIGCGTRRQRSREGQRRIHPRGYARWRRDESFYIDMPFPPHRSDTRPRRLTRPLQPRPARRRPTRAAGQSACQWPVSVGAVLARDRRRVPGASELAFPGCSPRRPARPRTRGSHRSLSIERSGRVTSRRCLAGRRERRGPVGSRYPWG